MSGWDHNKAYGGRGGSRGIIKDRGRDGCRRGVGLSRFFTGCPVARRTYPNIIKYVCNGCLVLMKCILNVNKTWENVQGTYIFDLLHYSQNLLVICFFF